MLENSIQTLPINEVEEAEITIQSLLESGAHFGSKLSQWNPKAAGFIYGIRNDIYIINLDKTIEMWKKARQAVVDVISKGGTILLVGTKPNIKNMVVDTAHGSGCFYVSHRWLGGTLTNFKTLQSSIQKLNKLESLLEKATAKDTTVLLTKKEIIDLEKRIAKLNTYFGGLKGMTKLPNLIFVTDLTKDGLAVTEANKLNIPVVALVDTNSDPTNITYPIPANDDAISTQKLFLKVLSQTILEGNRVRDENSLIEQKVAESLPVSEVVVERKH